MPQPTTRPQPQPTTQNNQQATTNNQQPTSNKQQATTNNQHQQPTTNHPTTQPPNPQPPTPNPNPTPLPPHFPTPTTTTRLHQVYALSPAVDLQGGRWRCGLCRQAEAGATAADALASRAVAPMAVTPHHSFDHAEHAAPRSQRTGTRAGECEVLKSREAPRGPNTPPPGSGQHRFWWCGWRENLSGTRGSALSWCSTPSCRRWRNSWWKSLTFQLKVVFGFVEVFKA